MSESQQSDPLIKHAYRALGREEPPAWLEQKLLRAAREAVGAHASVASRSFAMRFGFPLALAAVLVLSVSLVMVMRDAPDGHEVGVARDVAEAPAAQQSPPVPTAAQVHQRDQRASVPVAPLAEADPATKERQVAALRRPESEGVAAGEARNAIVPRLEPPGSPPTPIGDVMKREHVEQAAPAAIPGSPPVAAERPAARAAAPAAGAAAPTDSASAAPGDIPRARQSTRAAEAIARPQAESTKQAEFDYTNPERWLSYIIELRQQGREREARENLEAFRKRFPEHPIPETLR